MNYKELYDKIHSGEIKLPLEVTIIEPLWEDFELDKGCKAKLSSLTISDEFSDETHTSYSIHFDFSEYVDYNKSFWDHDYYDYNGNPTLAYYETKNWKTKCNCLVEEEYDVEFSFNTNEIVTFESVIGRHVTNGFYDGAGEIVGKPFVESHIGKKVKVTVEFLED